MRTTSSNKKTDCVRSRPTLNCFHQLLKFSGRTVSVCPKVPVIIVADTSASMNGENITQLNQGLAQFQHELVHNARTRAQVEVALMSFGNQGVHVVRDFAPMCKGVLPALQAGGSTPMGEAVNKSLDILDAHTHLFKKVGIQFYQPWLVLLSDGGPTDDISAVAARTRRMMRLGELNMIAVGVGCRADYQTLGSFCWQRPAFSLKKLCFNEFFTWLSRSIQFVSPVHMNGRTLALPSPDSWQDSERESQS